MRFKKTVICLILFMVLSLGIYALPTGIKANQVVLGTIVMNYTGIYNVSELVVNGSISVATIDGPINWTKLQNYPAACPSNSFVSTLADSITCTIPNDNDSVYYTVFLNQTLGITDAAANARFINQSIQFDIFLNITNANVQYVNITDGNVQFLNITDANVQYLNVTDGNDQFLNLTGGIISGSLNISQNISFNMVIGEMWLHNDSPTVGSHLGVQDKWANITNMTCGFQQSITCIGTASDDVQSQLIIQTPGIYDVTYSISFSGGSADDYHIAIAVNNITQVKTEIHRKLGTGGDVGAAADGAFLSLSEGDVVTLRAYNDDASVDVAMSSAVVRIRKVGN